MTITPLPVSAPGAAGTQASGSALAGQGTAAEDFGMLVTLHLTGQEPPTGPFAGLGEAAGQAAALADPSETADHSGVDPADDPADGSGDLAGTLVGMAVPVALRPTSQTTVAPTDGSPGAAAAAQAQPVDGEPTAAPEVAEGEPETGRPTTPSGEDGETGQGPATATLAGEGGRGAGPAPSQGDTAASPPAAATGSGGTAASPATPRNAETASVPVTAAASVGATATTAPAPAAPAGQSNPVTAQVFPAVPTLVSRGAGTHSITLRLHPADLGEVHVTVTVKDGTVDVTLAAGREAQHALRSGTGELRSLLDLVGATSGQLVVRDLATTAPTPSAASSLPASDGAGADTGDASGRERTSDDDGHRAHDERASAAASGDGHTSKQPANPRPSGLSRTAGLDLTL
jgi:flagellar hook-length control protein FliK